MQRRPNWRRPSSSKGVRVIDLSGAFRLRDADERGRWYPETHDVPGGVAYGLTERERAAVSQARLVANPGCYPTASLLALAPLADAGVLVPGRDIIIDAKSGVSGAGRTPTERTHFSEVHGSMSAYGVFGHRHGAEIEQGLGRQVTFTPHLAPLDRGIFATIYVRVSDGTSDETLGDIYAEAYAGDDASCGRSAPRCRRSSTSPTPTSAIIGWRVDPSGRAIVVSVLDNLLKGASGQAVQNMNVMLGLPEADRPAVTGRPVVVKFGGELLEQPDRLSTVVSAMARVRRPRAARHRPWRRQGDRRRAERARASRSGRSTASASPTTATLDVVVGVLAGSINTRLVAALGAAGLRAVGLTGADGSCGLSDVAPPHRSVDGRTVDLGRVGVPSARRRRRAWSGRCSTGGFVPVIASIGVTAEGQLLNVNADTFAGRLAERLEARRLVVAGHDGRRAGRSRARRSPCSKLADIQRLIGSGTATAGMIAKLRACEEALANGVGDVVIVDGRDAAALEAAALDRAPASATRIVQATLAIRQSGIWNLEFGMPVREL